MGSKLQAVALSVDWEAEVIHWTFFEGPEARRRASAFAESVKDDWPGTWVVVGNAAANEAASDALMEALGLSEENTDG